MSSAVETVREDRISPAQPSPVPELPLLVIEPRPGWHLVNLRELWRSRELLYFLVWRDIQVRYKQTVLGIGWAVLKPFITCVVFSLFFGRLAKLSSASGVDYSLFVFAGLLPWTFFSTSIGASANSIVGNQHLITKIYFPRLYVPMAEIGGNLVDFALGIGMLVVMMACFGVYPGWGALLALLIVLGLVGAALGLGTLLAALTVSYRDVSHLVPFMMQLWMFATPSIYMALDDSVSPRARALLPLNPAYGLIANFRQAMLGGPLDLYALAVSGTVSLILLTVGCLYFRRVERAFADTI